MTPGDSGMSKIEEAVIEKAVNAGCDAAGLHLACTYPKCKCQQTPVIVLAAVLAASEALQPIRLVVDDGAVSEIVKGTIAYIATNQSQCGLDGDFDVLAALAVVSDIVSHPAIRAALTAQGTDDGWRDISTAPKGRKIIVGYFNEAGNWRSVMACYYLPKTLDWNTDYEGGDEDGFAPEGWYEEIENTETIFPMKAPTHWRPLPPPPARKGDGG